MRGLVGTLKGIFGGNVWLGEADLRLGRGMGLRFRNGVDYKIAFLGCLRGLVTFLQ